MIRSFDTIIISILEFGLVFELTRTGYNILQILIVLLAYQLGSIFDSKIMLPKPLFVIFGGLSFIALLILHSYMWIAFSIFMLSICVHSINRIYRTHGNLFIRNICRIVGILLSSFFSWAAYIIICVAINGIIILTSTSKFGFKKTACRLTKPLVLMIVHRAHYFTYIYVSTFAFYLNSLGNEVLTPCIIALGWVVYIIAKKAIH